MKKQLIINLTENKSCIKNIKDNIKISLKEYDLNFQASPLAGYGVIGINRLKVSSNESSSKVGGYFAHYMKCNSYDYITITGQSLSPVYIYIDKENIEINSAKDFYLQNPKKTESIIKERLRDDVEIAEIGIAGVNKVDFSKIMFRGEKSCGKNNLGKLMGEKNIKAIVLKKHENIKLKDMNLLTHLNKLIASRLGHNPIEDYFKSENNCYGCNINCKSTSIKKLIKKGYCQEEAEGIDNLCNEYGMDSLLFSDLLNPHLSIEENAQLIIKNKVTKDLKEETLHNHNKKEDELDKLGFCKFLINKNIISEEEIEKFIKDINLV